MIAYHPSPLGPLTLSASEGAITEILFADQTPRTAIRAAEDSATREDERVLDRARAQLDAYFEGTRTSFDLPLRPQGTEFQRTVWTALRTLGHGTTCSYAALARQLGRPEAARAVGAANGRNRIAIVIPCHRVIGASGTLTGYAGGLSIKAWLLDHERRAARLDAAL